MLPTTCNCSVLPMAEVVANALAYVISMTNPAALSLRGWFMASALSLIFYFRHVSTLSSRPKNAPCPDSGVVFRVMYGAFSTRISTAVRALPRVART